MGVINICKIPISLLNGIQSRATKTREIFLLDGFPTKIFCLMCDDVIVWIFINYVSHMNYENILLKVFIFVLYVKIIMLQRISLQYQD